MIPLKKRLREDILARLGHLYPLEEADIEIGYPPRPEFGDLSVTFPFKLARELKMNPRELAREMLGHLSGIAGIAKAEIAGPGYINFFLDREIFFRGALAALSAFRPAPEERKIIIEHTNINPNKAAHIGHLRNACLGDTLARCLRHKGENVEVQNYIDDTGVQVVDVVFGFLDLKKKGLRDLEDLPGRFDYYCWDLYARTSSYLAEHPEAQERRAAILKKIEHGEGEEAALGQAVSRRILSAHLETMKRIGITYDLLPCESSILGLKFWEKAFTLLKEKGAISLAEDGVNAGCWIMKFAEAEEREKVIVRSDGTVTYVGKDIAYQLWKFGLLGRDFHYEPFLEEGGKTLWITTTTPNSRPLSFGGASTVYNVIDSRQAYLQKIVAQGLRSLGFAEQADRSVHFAYEMVALSPKSLKELGYEVRDEEKDRSFLEVSGRKGLGVKADDLLDRLEDKALAEVAKRNPDLAPGARAAIARAIASGALRYFMLKFARNSLIVFDFEEALSFEGETGPYLQYTGVRLSSIFRKLADREGFDEAEVRGLIRAADFSTAGLPGREAADFWDLATTAAQFEEHVLHSVYSLEFSHLAKFAFILCQKTNAYYHLYSILNEKSAGLKKLRIAALFYVREILDRAFGLMGIPQPEKM
ncbi:MAG: arginine--tRNA ligase [Candidatus Aminicenantes bacterium RBG_16_63_16]|nr:MAG: arginine--tRNA ligase [Candidatus Aminicenantes bacterium RBG_16_63_16]